MTITNKSRYGQDRVFEQVDDTHWKVSGEMNYASTSYNEKDETTSWDPEGGMFLGLGMDLNVDLLPHKEFLNSDHKLIITKLEPGKSSCLITVEKQLIKSHEKNSIKKKSKTS